MMNEQLELVVSHPEVKSSAKILEHEIKMRVAAEWALVEKQRDFDYLFKRNPLPMWIYEIQSLSFVEVNEAAVMQYGLTRDEFLSMKLKDMLPVELLQVMGNGGSRIHAPYQHSSTWHHPHKNGSVLEVDIVNHAMTFNGQQCFMVVALDVTERNATEARLRRTQKLETIGQLTGGVATTSTIYSPLSMAFWKVCETAWGTIRP